MPTDTSSTYEGPLAGLQYSPSGLQQLSTLAGLFAPTGSAGTGASAVEGLIKAGKGAFDVIKGLFPTSYTYDGTGNSGTGGDGGFTG